MAIALNTNLSAQVGQINQRSDRRIEAANRKQNRDNLFAIIQPAELEIIKGKLDAIDLSNHELELIQANDARDARWNDHDFNHWGIRILKAADLGLVSSYEASKLLLFLQTKEDYPDCECIIFQLVNDDGTINYNILLDAIKKDRSQYGHLYRLIFNDDLHRQYIACSDDNTKIGLLKNHEQLKTQLQLLYTEKGACATQVFNVQKSFGSRVPPTTRASIIPPEVLTALLPVRFGDEAALPSPVIGGQSPTWRLECTTHRDMRIPTPASLGLTQPSEAHDTSAFQTKCYAPRSMFQVLNDSALSRKEREYWVNFAKKFNANCPLYEFLSNRNFSHNRAREGYKPIYGDENTIYCPKYDVRADIHYSVINLIEDCPDFDKLTQSELKLFVNGILDIPEFDFDKFFKMRVHGKFTEKFKKTFYDNVLPKLEKAIEHRKCPTQLDMKA